MTETFGPEYVRPASPPCPDCTCCSKALCDRGRAIAFRCAGLLPSNADPEVRAAVAGCPCSSEAIEGTEAWRAARIREAKRQAAL